MTEQERLAREWAEYYQDDFPKFTEGSRAAEIVKKAKAAAEYIIANTTPPTMDEIGWDKGEHFLAGADGKYGGEVVMIAACEGEIRVALPDDPSQSWLHDPSGLAPNGKRYELREVGPEHPKTLRTVEDLESAPKGTIISQSGEYVLLKRGIVWSIVGDVRVMDSGIVAAGLTSEANVLRWGDGK